MPPTPPTSLSRTDLESHIQSYMEELYVATGDDLLTGTLLNNIAVLYHEIGEFQTADNFHHRALSHWERALPKNHTWIAQSLSNRAALYRDMEVYPEAERVFQLALAIWRASAWPVIAEEPNTLPLWSERPNFRSGHVLPRYRSAVQRLKAEVEAGDPAALTQLDRTLEKLGPWYHNVPLGNGRSTQASLGNYPNARWEVLADFFPGDFSGKTTLDIGCNSGFFSFKMKERNAARVIGIDVTLHVLAQARFLSQWFDYPIELYHMDAYNVDQLGTPFDAIVFLGVLYHLKHPLYALEKVAGVCRGTMYFQTVLRGPIGDFEPKEDYPIVEEGIFNDPNFPRLYLVEKSFNGDASNWWFATRSCVKAMLRIAGFDSIVETKELEVFVCSRTMPAADIEETRLPTYEEESGIVKVLWGEQSPWTSSVEHWLQHPKVQERLDKLASGQAGKNRFEYFMETYCGDRLPFQQVITLGCGHGELERGLARHNFALSHDAIDLAEGAIEDAARLAKAEGLEHVHYIVADLNAIELPENTYDVVFGISSIHHTTELERLFDQVARSLKPGGYFFLDEFIGPNQFQWTNAQLRAVNQALAAMPRRLRECVDRRAGTKGPVTRPTIEEMNRIDPSEAIRSAEIMPLLSQTFDVLDFRGCGGSLLHLLLEHIAGNFSESDPESMEYLESLFKLEDDLIQSGVLQHDFAVIIARKRQ